jgi:hypothetical protein
VSICGGGGTGAGDAGAQRFLAQTAVDQQVLFPDACFDILDLPQVLLSKKSFYIEQ